MVNRCICSNVSFLEVKKIAAERNLQSADELRLNEICCRHCQLCRPYVEEMLKTGKTSFDPAVVPGSKFSGHSST